VLAEALSERSDPRGELIAEQHRRKVKGSSTPTKRERALLKLHAESWLGPLAKVLRQPMYTLGFLAAATLKGERARLSPAGQAARVENNREDHPSMNSAARTLATKAPPPEGLVLSRY